MTEIHLFRSNQPDGKIPTQKQRILIGAKISHLFIFFLIRSSGLQMHHLKSKLTLLVFNELEYLSFQQMQSKAVN